MLREAEQLYSLLREEGKEPVVYVIGRKGVNYYRFRRREVEASWTGFSEQPTYADAAEAARTLVAAFMADEDDDEQSVDELHSGVHAVQEPGYADAFKHGGWRPLVVEYKEDEAVAGRGSAAL